MRINRAETYYYVELRLDFEYGGRKANYLKWDAYMGEFDSQITIGAIDVGAPKNIGWAITRNDHSLTGTDLDEFVDHFCAHAKDEPAALGFEAPLFIPLRDRLEDITKQRDGERGRPWSAGAGATVTTIGLAVVSYTLTALQQRLPDKKATLDWRNWPSGNDLLLFEAFVSGSNHAAPGEHWRDALSAVEGFKRALPDLDAANAVTADNCLSLVGTCLARTGWVKPDRVILNQPCLVIRPDKIAGH